MKTRKEIKDKNGERSIYVIEVRSTDGKWCIIGRDLAFSDYADAVIEKNKLANNWRIGTYTWRVALYVRSE